MIIAVCAVVTALIRALPFILYPEGKQPPAFVTGFSRLLPSAVMGMLVVYCLKDVTPYQYPYGLPELIASVMVAGSYVWKRNTVLSILLGTGLYMVLVNFVF